MSLEAAKLRYSNNFGTSVCNQCDGLHAGVGVWATCFEMKQCHYSNFKEGAASPRQLRVLRNLTEAPK